LIRADLHVHTGHSVDSYMSYKALIETCLKKNINCIAVSDHGTTRGARDLMKMAPFKVIVCEEVRTPYGEIMGMFLHEDIPDKISVEKTIEFIREQGGLVCIPHPFDIVRPSAFRNKKKLEEIIDQVDIIEVFNSRSMFPGAESRARDLATRYNKIISAGTDAHSPEEVGYAFVEMPEFTDQSDYLSSLSEGKIHGKKSSPLIHLISTTARLKKRHFEG